MPQSTWSLDFDGTGYVGSASTINIAGGDFTISLWVYPDAVSAYRAIFAAENNMIEMYLQDASNIYWRLAAAEGSLASSETWTTGEWQHVAWKRSGSSNTFFRNGISTATLSRGTTAAAELFFLARDRNGGGSNWDGKIDDCAIWLSALTDGQIANLAAGTLDPSTISPDFMWRLEEGSGTTTDDGSAGSNTGTFTGGVAWDPSVPSQLAGGGTPTLEQHSYRWKNNDGNEAAATFRGALNTPVAIGKLTPVRNRILANATGDLASERLKLQYRRVGSDLWRDVGTGA